MAVAEGHWTGALRHERLGRLISDSGEEMREYVRNGRTSIPTGVPMRCPRLPVMQQPARQTCS